MSDHNQTGTPNAATGANASEPAAFGTFGATRGSVLARGKRAAPPTAPAASAAASGYKPSSLEVITPKSEYVNPFTGEAAANAPVSPEQVERIVNEPAPQAAPTPVAPIAQAAPVFIAPAPVAPQPVAPSADLFPLEEKADLSAEGSAKAELKILPPQEEKRSAVSWDASTGSEPRREERSTFRTERNRRENPSGEQREGREGREEKPFEPREPRRDERKFEPRAQPYHHYDDREETREHTPRAEQSAPTKKSGGFFGWLKSLFGGGKSADAPAAGNGEPRPNRDGEHGGRRRHRGGRGRNQRGFQGDNRGPRDGQQQPRDPREGGEQSHGGGEPRGEGFDGGGGRRRRGGRGRFRGEGGGDNRGPRPEGQAGGGAI